MTTLLWLTAPYIAITSFVVGHLWRYRHDQFGWTTRSSQLHESRLLRLGSPMFHYGILAVLAGHVVGVLIPASWTHAVGISEDMYHWTAVITGAIAGFATIAGLAILVYRRIKVTAVRQSTTAMDKVMYLLLIGALITGMLNTLWSNLVGGRYDYRETVSPWFRSLFSPAPSPEVMVTVPLNFQVHVLTVVALIALWPYTRLVHVFSAPIGYLVRPFVVYRSRDVHPQKRKYARAWEQSPAARERR